MLISACTSLSLLVCRKMETESRGKTVHNLLSIQDDLLLFSHTEGSKPTQSSARLLGSVFLKKAICFLLVPGASVCLLLQSLIDSFWLYVTILDYSNTFFYYEVILNLYKNPQNSTENSWRSFTLLHLTSYVPWSVY